MLTEEQKQDLAFIVRVDYVTCHGRANFQAMERYGPLADLGYVTIRDIGSDEAQETILRIAPTDAGRKALEGK